VVNIPSHIFVSIFLSDADSPANVTARSRLVTGFVTGQVQKFSHFPQVVTVSRVKRGMGGPAIELTLYPPLIFCGSSCLFVAIPSPLPFCHDFVH
jgi:hypothetical protein